MGVQVRLVGPEGVEFRLGGKSALEEQEERFLVGGLRGEFLYRVAADDQFARLAVDAAQHRLRDGNVLQRGVEHRRRLLPTDPRIARPATTQRPPARHSLPGVTPT